MGQINLVDTMEKGKCSGCKMCGDLCPQGAITFESDEKGFWYPVIDHEKCTECGLCMKKCPAAHVGELKSGNEPVVYAAWSKDSAIRQESTSGGLFWELAKRFIENGGAVAGCRYTQDYKGANHFLAHTMEELEQLRGSKYFQSDTSGIYKAVKQEIQNGKEVLFCGTPCQNAALSMYLGKDQKNVFYLDFICRSINSPLAYREYIKELEQEYDSEVAKVHMKNKKTGWRSLALQVLFENGKESHRDRNKDWWMQGFLKHDLYTRDSCYDCAYRTLPRVTADITFGDFWGIVGESEYDMFRGISVLMLNSEKGIRLFEEIKPNLYYKEKELADVLPGNVALKNSPKKTEKSDFFFEYLKECSFSEAVMRSTGEKEKKERKNSLFSMLGQLRKDRKRYEKRGEISARLYLYYNYFCPNVERKGNGKIIPYKNAVLELHPTARIVMCGDRDLEIGTAKLKGSKAETYVKMASDAVWNVRRGGEIAYESTVVLHSGAVFDTGYFTMNVRGSVIVDKKVTFGEDVMLARNVIVIDSDFHQLQNDCGEQMNPPEEVVIGNHVWLGAGSIVLKGVSIGQDSVVAAGTVVTKSMPRHRVIAGKGGGTPVRDSVNWKRERCVKNETLFREKKMILYGYGMYGKAFERKYKDRIAYIIDNFSNDEKVVSFKDFAKKFPELEEGYVWVIASPNYYDELYRQIKKKYPNMPVVRAEI